MISNAEGVKNSEYIANSFWSQNIAQVSSIVLLPYLKNNKLCQMAYIEIASWCDSEVAYNFIRRLKVLEGEARLNHNLNEDWWAVQINTHYNGQPFTDASTVTFSQKNFVKTVDEVEDGETLTDTEIELDEQSTREEYSSYYGEQYSREQYYGEQYYGEPYYNEEFLDQKMCIEELLDEEMYDNQEEMMSATALSATALSATALSATALYHSPTYDGLQSLYDQALYNKKDSADKLNDGLNDKLNDELMCGQYLCDKYHTYQFLYAQ
jgi:hypothetical protein